jgi:hypothetical protein
MGPPVYLIIGAIINVNTKGVLGTGGICYIGMGSDKGGSEGASGIMERKGWAI